MTKKRGIITATSLIIFVILTILVCTQELLAFDTVIREWFYSIRTPWLTEVVKAVTFMGNTETIVVLCIAFLVVPLIKGRSGLPFVGKVGVPVAAAAIVGSAINKLIKHTVMRPRPDVSLHLIEQGGWSFPSGHSISGLLMYGLLAWLIIHYVKGRNGGALAGGGAETGGARRNLLANIAIVLLTLLWIGVGLSRVYLGVHYPSDVLGGWTLGMVIMMIVIAVVDRKARQ